MNTANTAIVANQEQITKAVKKESSAAKARRAPGKATVVKVAQAKTGDTVVTKGKATASVKATLKAIDREANAKAAKAVAAEEQARKPKASEPKVAAAAFGALAGALAQPEVKEAAKAAAKKAIDKASGKGKAVAAPKKAQPASAKLAERFALGAYNGKAGTMYSFIMRCGTLGDTFSREDAVANMTAKPPVEALATRAQVLDYFAWAARHGLLVVAADQSTPAGVVVKVDGKQGKAATKAIKANAKTASKKAAAKA